MKTHWKLMLILAVLCLAVLMPAGTAMAVTTTVVTSGAATGTHITTLDQNAATGALTQGLGADKIVSTQSTHGSYLSPPDPVTGKQTLYVNTFAPSAADGGRYGLLTYQKNALSVWTKTGFIAEALEVGDQSVDIPVSMMCATDVMSKNAPDVLATGDIATGLELFYNMSTGAWTAVLAGTGTNCDMSFRESQGDDEALSTGHHNNVYHWTSAAGAKDGMQPAPNLAGAEFAAAKLGHQNRTFTLDGIEYYVWSDGSSGDLVFVKTSQGDAKQYARFHIVEGENHAVGLDLGMDSIATGKINGIVPNFADGSFQGVQLYHKDPADANGDGDKELDVAIAGDPVFGTGTIGDICGLDIVDVAGKGWRRN